MAFTWPVGPVWPKFQTCSCQVRALNSRRKNLKKFKFRLKRKWNALGPQMEIFYHRINQSFSLNSYRTVLLHTINILNPIHLGRARKTFKAKKCPSTRYRKIHTFNPGNITEIKASFKAFNKLCASIQSDALLIVKAKSPVHVYLHVKRRKLWNSYFVLHTWQMVLSFFCFHLGSYCPSVPPKRKIKQNQY